MSRGYGNICVRTGTNNPITWPRRILTPWGDGSNWRLFRVCVPRRTFPRKERPSSILPVRENYWPNWDFPPPPEPDTGFLHRNHNKDTESWTLLLKHCKRNIWYEKKCQSSSSNVFRLLFLVQSCLFIRTMTNQFYLIQLNAFLLSRQLPHNITALYHPSVQLK